MTSEPSGDLARTHIEQPDHRILLIGSNSLTYGSRNGMGLKPPHSQQGFGRVGGDGVDLAFVALGPFRFADAPAEHLKERPRPDVPSPGSPVPTACVECLAVGGESESENVPVMRLRVENQVGRPVQGLALGVRVQSSGKRPLPDRHKGEPTNHAEPRAREDHRRKSPPLGEDLVLPMRLSTRRWVTAVTCRFCRRFLVSACP
ncbi:MAG: hypothetical protein CNCCGFBP_01074 [Fimbriimonadaceae bacterium]|nr:hypothetical protein [Fimbriimonadaceae bacterium]